MTKLRPLSENQLPVCRPRWQLSLRSINAFVAVVAIGLGWVVSVRTPHPGWMLIPAAMWFGLFIGNRSSGRLSFRLTVGVLAFVGFVAVGAYATALLQFSLGLFEPQDMVEALAPMGFVVFLPVVIVVAFLLLRGFVIALNSKD